MSKEKYYTLFVFHKHKSSVNYWYIYGKIQERVNKVDGYCRLKRPRSEEGNEPLGYVPWPLMTAGGSMYVISSPGISEASALKKESFDSFRESIIGLK